jgi:TrmH family RNA methyltransferase
LQRRRDRIETGRFLAEGPRAVSEALDQHRRAAPTVVEIFVTDGADVRHPELVHSAQALGVPIHVVSEHVAVALSETRAPQGVVAVCLMPTITLAEAVDASSRLVAVLVDVADPGNAGTVMRVADAAGADAVIFAGDAVDPYNGKCVRASTGSIFHLPVVHDVSVDAVADVVQRAGALRLAAAGDAERSIDDAEADGTLAGSSAWFFGNEVRGLGSVPSDLALRIPIYGRAESLNLATAAAVCLYASARAQRRAAGG